MQGDIAVSLRVGIDKTLRAAQGVNVGLLAGQEQPARLDFENVFGVFLQNGHRVEFGLQGHGVEKHVLAHALAKHVLHLAQVGIGGGAAPLAAAHHKEVEQDNAVAHQIVVEMESLPRVGHQGHIGQEAMACGIRQRPLGPCRRSRCLRRPQRTGQADGGRHGAEQPRAEKVSAVHFHPLERSAAWAGLKQS